MKDIKQLLPLRAEKNVSDYCIWGAKDSLIAERIIENDAEFIVKACNMHYELVDIAKDSLWVLNSLKNTDELCQHEFELLDRIKNLIEKLGDNS